MTIAFFEASRRFYADHQEFSTVCQTAAVGMFNLRREVNAVYDLSGYFDNGTKPNHNKLRQKFLNGSGLTKIDFLQLASPDFFPADLDVLTRMVLISNISLFEGWVDALSVECDLNKNQKGALEWPSQSVYPRKSPTGRSAGPGCPDMLSSLRTSEESSIMVDAFGPILTRASEYVRGNLDNFYVCFRAWKEARNCIIHRGGRASDRFTRDAQQLFNLPQQNLSPLKWSPRLKNFKVGEPIDIPFKDVLSFSQVLRCIVCTVDAELAQTQHGERVFFEKFKDDRRRFYCDIPSDARRRQRVIGDICLRMKLPRPANSAELDSALTKRLGFWLRPPAIT